MFLIIMIHYVLVQHITLYVCTKISWLLMMGDNNIFVHDYCEANISRLSRLLI